MKQEMMGRQWRLLNHMKIICTSLQTGNHISTSSLISTGRMLFLIPNKQCQSTEGKKTWPIKQKLKQVVVIEAAAVVHYIKVV